MAEPISQAVLGIKYATLAAGLTGAVLAALGVPYLALLWATIGSVVALVFTPPESRSSAILAVIAGGLSGAAFGHGGTDIAGRVMPSLAGSDAILIFASLVCGAGAKPLVSAGIARVQKLIEGSK